ncbi:hypothetical protein [Actinokineospora globicatena]|uniref:hypothetical protein n=1 Tax=Actinokineospora globicatena TaxID=103729 RepID=UPI0020A3FD38|nr:hypothetical protein [Actinokineospora globicatena]MCP2301475.1 hypothetical protein [Actinokineospora globicatena]
MTLHAFVDESSRGDAYLLVAACLDPAQLNRTRKLMKSLLLPGQRELHFKRESPRLRRLALSRMEEAGLGCWVYAADCGNGHEPARQACLAALTVDLLGVDATRMVMDSRDDRDRLDEATIRVVLTKIARASGLVYEHHHGPGEPLLWIADAVAWSVGAGGDWGRRSEPLVGRRVTVPVPG